MLQKYGVFRLLCCPVVVLFVVIGLISIVSAQAAETVAVIGTGRVGGALGPRFAELGYTVIYGSRDPSKEKVQELVERTGKDALAISQRVAWKSMKLTMASRSEVWTHCPVPVRSRAINAARTPCVRNVPDAVSEMATPAREGPVPGGPVTLIKPPMPCAIWSSPGRSAYGPSWPKPEMLA